MEGELLSMCQNIRHVLFKQKPCLLPGGLQKYKIIKVNGKFL
jgi:hypothetical protein